MGHMLAGRVTAVWGTHTHVPTAEPRRQLRRTDRALRAPQNLQNFRSPFRCLHPQHLICPKFYKIF